MLVSRISIEDFGVDLRSAMRLREQFFARELDRAFVNAKGRIIYAVDSSVLHQVFPKTAYTLPRREQKKDPIEEMEKPHAFRVFRGPSSDPALRMRTDAAERRLGAVVSSFLLEGFAGSGSGGIEPLLLLPGHAIEANQLYARIADEFYAQKIKLDEAETKSKDLNDLRAAIAKGHGDKEAEYRAVLDQLFDILYAIEVPHEQFHRYNQLTREQRLLKMETAASYPGFHGEAFRVPGGSHVFNAQPQLKRQWHAKDDAKGSLQWWEEHLEALPWRYRENDRLALRALDLLNRQLRDKGVRVILFTLNDAIIDVAREYRPYENEQGSDLREMTFADLYLRHPRCLLAEEALASPVEVDTRNPRSGKLIGGWLDAMLDDALEGWRRVRLAEAAASGERVNDLLTFRRWREHDGHNDKLFEERKLKAALQQNEGVHVRFVERWSNHIKNLCDAHSAATPLARESIHRALVLDEEEQPVINAIERIKAHVWDLTEKSWTDFFNTAADTGLELIKATTEDLPMVWPIPQLVMRGSGQRVEILRALWTIADVRQRTDAVTKAIAALRDDTRFPNSYVHALGYGVIFASVDRWRLTRLLAQRAAQIVLSPEAAETPTPPGEETIDGREAQYLLAQAWRITGDLDRARDALNTARHSFGLQAEDGLLPPLTGLRFEVESFEIQAALLMRMVEAERSAQKANGRRSVNTDIRRQLVHLGRNALQTLVEAKHCGSLPIKTQAQIALRSIYFTSFALLAEASGRPPRMVADDNMFGGRGELAKHVNHQAHDINTAYPQKNWLPLRDRVLLQIVASAAGVILPDELKRSYREQSAATETPEHSIAPEDRAMLLRLERLVTH